MKYAIQAKIWVGDKHVFDIMLTPSPRSLSQDNACFHLGVFISIIKSIIEFWLGYQAGYQVGN